MTKRVRVRVLIEGWKHGRWERAGEPDSSVILTECSPDEAVEYVRALERLSMPPKAPEEPAAPPHEVDGALLPDASPDRADGIPYVGQGASHGYGSDSYPYTVVEVNRTGSRIKLRRDDHRVVSGTFMEGSAVCEYRTNLSAGGFVATRRKDGTYRPKGSKRRGTPSVILGGRHYYQDPHF